MEHKEIPPSLKIKMNGGGIILIIGNLIMLFSKTYFYIGFIMGIAGVLIVIPAVKQAKSKSNIQLSEKQYNFRFIISCIAILAGLYFFPFITPQQNGVTLKLSLIVSTVLAPFCLGINYWVFFIKVAKDRRNKDT